MAKLASKYPTAARKGSPMATTGPALTYEGGAAHEKDAKTALFTLAITNFVSEDTFYESATKRDARFAALVRQVATEDPAWVQGFIPWLRNEANMRTASLVAAVEYVKAGAPNGRQVIASACSRADEPGEILAYTLGVYGRAVPMPIKRGVADAAVRLYNEKSFIKWDSSASSMRFGDVIELTHPKAKATWQSQLFRRAIEDRHNRAVVTPVNGVDGYRNWIKAGAPIGQLPEAATWENVSAHHKMDAASWEAIIPKMGYMALLRNLRNFEQAKVSTEVLVEVANKLSDPAEVEKSRQLPFRFWSAWKASGSMRFGQALEDALQHSVRNIPELPGRTLVAVDASGSMRQSMSAKSEITRVEAAALFGAATINRSAPGSRMIVYATDWREVTGMSSVLRTTEAISQLNGVNGHGTNTWPSVSAAWNRSGPFDRVYIFTDMQDHPSSGDSFIPRHVPVYSWDLSGYTSAHTDLTPGSGRYLLGGLSDKAFQLVRLIDQDLTTKWPWE